MNLKKLAILAVDDERIILDSLRIQIEKTFKQEYLFELAESAEEALEVIDDLVGEGIELLLVISDYQMPGMKGDEFAATIKTKLPYLNIILLTGQITEQKSFDLVNRNIVLKVLQKPWKEKDLLDVINNLLANAEQ
jgi:CheY-like chemotaxis protein